MHALAPFNSRITALNARWHYPHLNDQEIEKSRVIDLSVIAALLFEANSVKVCEWLLPTKAPASVLAKFLSSSAFGSGNGREREKDKGYSSLALLIGFSKLLF